MNASSVFFLTFFCCPLKNIQQVKCPKPKKPWQ